MEKCPKCGAEKTANPNLFACCTVKADHMEIGVIESEICLRRQLAAANERVAELEMALIRLRDCDWTITLPDRMDAVRDIAHKALGGSHA